MVKEAFTEVSKAANGALGSNSESSISKQTGHGLNERRGGKFTEDESIDRTHGNMVACAGTAIAGGVAVKKGNLLAGVLLLLFAIVLFFIIVGDWFRGYSHVNTPRARFVPTG
jgi:hypothetical protein